MRRRPRSLALPIPAVASAGIDKSQAAKAYRKDAVNPFLASGGASYFLPEFTNEHFDVRRQGIQLVTYVYVPKGSIGFLKELRVAPFRGTVFSPFSIPLAYAVAEPEPHAVLAYGTHQEFNPESAPSVYPERPRDYWINPFGWENHFNSYDLESFPPSWRWYLRIIPGNIEDLRLNGTNLPPKPIPFTEPPAVNFYDSWFLVPDVAVPDRAYPEGIPGSSPGAPWDGQRVQVIQGDKLSLHIPIPEHSTLCLFTRWKQEPIPAVIGARDFLEETGLDKHYDMTSQAYFPLLPSWGSLLGYTQSSHQTPGNHNAQYGWNG